MIKVNIKMIEVNFSFRRFKDGTAKGLGCILESVWGWSFIGLRFLEQSSIIGTTHSFAIGTIFFVNRSLLIIGSSNYIWNQWYYHLYIRNPYIKFILQLNCIQNWGNETLKQKLDNQYPWVLYSFNLRGFFFYSFCFKVHSIQIKNIKLSHVQLYLSKFNRRLFVLKFFFFYLDI